MRFHTLEELKQEGFEGFKTVAELVLDKSAIPNLKGVYLVLNPELEKEFLEVGTGGFFKGENPNVSLNKLNSNWIDDSLVLYIGKAGSETGGATLRSKLSQYLSFGQGKPVGLKGGKYIWQLKNSKELIFCWKATPDINPRIEESKLIQEFKKQYGSRPFANLID